MYSILRYSILKSTVVLYNSWHTGASMEWTDKKSYCLEEGDKAGCGRAEGLSAAGDGGQAAISVTSDVTGYVKVWRYILISESSQLQGSYVGDLLYSITRDDGFPPCLQSWHKWWGYSKEWTQVRPNFTKLLLMQWADCVCVCVCVCIPTNVVWSFLYSLVGRAQIIAYCWILIPFILTISPLIWFIVIFAFKESIASPRRNTEQP